MKLSSIKIGLENITSTKTDICIACDANIAYKKDSDEKRSNEPESFLLTILSYFGQTFIVSIPYKTKLNTTFSDIKSRIELMGSTRVRFLNPTIKLYAFVNSKNELVSGVKVVAEDFSIVESDDSEVIM